MIRLAITGSLGRMGQSIYRFAKEDKDFDIVALLEKKTTLILERWLTELMSPRTSMI